MSVCCLLHSPTVTTLCLRGADLSIDRDFMLLAATVSTMPSLQRLDVSLNPLRPAPFDRSLDGVAALFRALGDSKKSSCASSLRHLDVSHVTILDEDTADCYPSRAESIRALSGATALETIVADGVVKLKGHGMRSAAVDAACAQLLDALHSVVSASPSATHSHATPTCTFRCNRGLEIPCADVK